MHLDRRAIDDFFVLLRALAIVLLTNLVWPHSIQGHSKAFGSEVGL